MPQLSPDAPATRPWDDHFAASLRGFGPIGILAIGAVYLGNSVFVPFGAILVLIWAWRSRTPWSEIGFVLPERWLRTVAMGIAFGVAFKLVMKALVMPLLGAPPKNQAFQFLVGNTAALPYILYVVLVGAAFGEEVLFRGYAFERFGKLFGRNRGAKPLIVLITAVWFGLEHYTLQGTAGVEQATIVGLVFGTIFAITGRLWMLIVAHAAFDLTAVAIIFWDFEWDVAHSVFR